MAVIVMAIRKKRARRQEAGLIADAKVGPVEPRAPATEPPLQIEDEACEERQQRHERGRCHLPHQAAVRTFYNRSNVQWAIAALIFANFAVTIADKQVDPQGTRWPRQFRMTYDAFNICFLFECLTNLYAHGWSFWRSGGRWNGWNLFDALVVTVGVIYVLNITLPAYSVLRILRAFRVFRLFKRVKSLNTIIVALGNAVPGMANAFVILLLVVCIYALIGVEFFSSAGAGGVLFLGGDFGNFSIGDTNAMGLDGLPFWFGDEYFGDFSKSLFTMFQILTGDSWGEMARPLLFGTGYAATAVSIYFVSFIILTTYILLNVVVAVLLEKIIDDGGAVVGAEPSHRNSIAMSSMHGVGVHRRRSQDSISGGSPLASRSDGEGRDGGAAGGSDVTLMHARLQRLALEVERLAADSKARAERHDEQLARVLALLQRRGRGVEEEEEEEEEEA